MINFKQRWILYQILCSRIKLLYKEIVLQLFPLYVLKLNEKHLFDSRDFKNLKIKISIQLRTIVQ